MSKLLSDKVKKIPPTEVSADRYEFLKLGEAEPDLGVPSSDGQVLTSDTTGTRAWVDTSTLLGYTGSKGDIGYTGSTGPQGPAGGEGSAGVLGYTGSQGIQGFTGSLGYTGSVGPVAGSANQIIYRNSSNVVTGSDNLVYDGVSIKVNGNLESTFSNGDEGGEIFLNKPQTNNTLAAGLTIDVFQNKLRFFENGGTTRGAYIDLTAAATGVGTNLLAGNTGFTGSQGNLGYTGSQGSPDTASDILTKIKTVDGTGSGLDADLLDGINSASFLRSDTNTAMSTGYLTLANDPTDTLHAATKQYVDSAVNAVLSLTKTLTLSTDWQNVGISNTDLATGSYFIQLYANDISSGGTNNNEYYSGVMSWYSGTTGSSLDLPTDEIVLHRAGGSGDGALYLRTIRTTGASNLNLQIYSNTPNASSANYVFKFKRMI